MKTSLGLGFSIAALGVLFGLYGGLPRVYAAPFFVLSWAAQIKNFPTRARFAQLIEQGSGGKLPGA
jgi:hypothetical protein